MQEHKQNTLYHHAYYAACLIHKLILTSLHLLKSTAALVLFKLMTVVVFTLPLTLRFIIISFYFTISVSRTAMSVKQHMTSVLLIHLFDTIFYYQQEAANKFLKTQFSPGNF